VLKEIETKTASSFEVKNASQLQ